MKSVLLISLSLLSFQTIAKISFKYIKLDGNPYKVTGARLPKKHIALTFDDGPNIRKPEYTLRVLDILESWGVKGHFFQIGRLVKMAPEISVEIIERGHVLAGHTETHRYLDRLNFNTALESEIKRGNETILSALKHYRSRSGDRFEKLDFFRFPGGRATSALRSYVLKSGTYDFHWNMDSGDWRRRPTKESVMKTTMTYIKMISRSNHGGMIVFHDYKRFASEVLNDVLTYLDRNDWTVIMYVGQNDPRKSEFI